MVWLTIIMLILFILINSKIKFLKLRDNSKEIIAEVVEYRKERNPIRNDYTRLNYPYVKIVTVENESIFVKLKYADNFKKSFKIGSKISVFWNENDLLYWNAFDKGLYKYLPSNWKFKK